MFTKSAPLSVVELAFCTALLSLSTLCVIAEGPGSGDVSSERCTLSSHGCGVALSGGGIPALVSALCVEGALDASCLVGVSGQLRPPYPVELLVMPFLQMRTKSSTFLTWSLDFH